MEGLMQIGFRLLDRIAATHTGALVLAYIEHLSAAEIKILIVLNHARSKAADAPQKFFV